MASTTMTRGSDQEHAEGPVARMIEEQTAKLPSDVFLWAATGEKMTMSPSRYLGHMLSPCTRAAKASASFKSGQLTYSSATPFGYDRSVKSRG